MDGKTTTWAIPTPCSRDGENKEICMDKEWIYEGDRRPVNGSSRSGITDTMEKETYRETFRQWSADCVRKVKRQHFTY